MKRFVAIAGVAVLGACLAGWAALAWAQPSLGKLSPADSLPPEPGVAASGKDTASKPSSSTKSSAANALETLPTIAPAAAPEKKPAASAQTAPAIPSVGPLSGTPPADVSKEPGPIGPLGAPTVAPQALPAGPMTPAKEGAQPLEAPMPGGSLPTLPGGSTPAGTTERPITNSTTPIEERTPEPSVTPDNTTGRQEPAVSLEWVGAPTAKVGQPGNYSLIVRNACGIPVQQVLVRVRVPSGISCSDTEPKAVTEDNVLIWELGTLQAKQEKVLQMKLLAEHKGDVTPQAWVTFTGSSVMRIRVREPKLVLKAQGPDKVMVGETAAFVLAVSNPGDGAAEQVKIHAVVSEGLEHPHGPKVDFEIGNLAAGETRTVTVMCSTKTGGVQKCEAVVEAEGGLNAKESASVNVIMPRLDLQLVGPGLRYLGRKAMYVLKVTNPGDAPASNVSVGDVVPEGFKVLAASDGGRHDFSTRTVSWFLGELAPGQTREVKMEVQAINPGEFKHKATAVGARGLRAEADLTTRVEGLSALMLEMVDTEDPIEVSSDTAYEIRITNTGSKVETDIKLVATIPDKMEFKSATGPVRFHEEGKMIVFEPLEKLAPKADAIFRINVKAAEAGTVRFKIQMTSTNLVEPVIKMEATRIYSDAPEVKPSH
jgi:uncharacterized repeat protein (TIGR01451 family)